MNIKSHLLETHTRTGEGLIANGKFHKKMSKHFAALSELAKGTKSDMGDGADLATICQQISDEHDAMAGACADQAAFHVECCKNLSASSKADGDEFDKLIPSDVSGIAPEAPNYRAVPRFGQREIPERPIVERELEKLIAVEGEL